MCRWPAVAVVAGIVGWMAGCSALVNLDGLAGGTCGGACSDAAVGIADAPPSLSDTGGRDSIDAALGTAPGDARGAFDGAPSDSSLNADTGAPDVAGPGADGAPCTPPTPASLNVCTGFGAMSAPPVIDGALDCGVPLWSMPVVVSSGPGPIPSSVQAVVAAAWRPDGLYLFVRVTGAGANRFPAPAPAPTWCGDAVELYIDDDGVYTTPPTYDNPGTVQLVAVAPPSASAPTSVGERFRDAKDIGPWSGRFVSEATSDGFTTEAFITAADLGLTSWSLSAGGTVGLDVAVDLGSSSQPATCPRLGQFTIQLPKGTPGGCAASCDVGEFCKPKLQ